MNELKTFLGDVANKKTDYDEAMVRKLIKKITVFDDHLTFEFEAGIEIIVKV